MNKTDKRQLNLRNKLLAAIAMLLVSSIMMVSSTYAWFTLSTAPEVQGITTTIGANGNLEIALSPADGDANKLTSAMGDSLKDDWTEKNLTWGNLINLSDLKYGLDEITLLPARLNLTGDSTSGYTIDNSPLATPVYGADGRLSGLDTTSTAIGERVLADGNDTVTEDSFVVNSNNTGLGVRAIGTSSSMTPEQQTFYTNLSKLGSSINNSKSKAQASLSAKGAELAEMAIAHANAGDASDTTNDYSKYIPALETIIDTLEEANYELEQSIRAAILVTVSSATANTAVEGLYDTVSPIVNDQTDLTTIWNTLTSAYSGVSSLLHVGNAYNNWVTINTNLASANTALENAKVKVSASQAVVWSDVSGIMTQLMNTNGVTINNKSLSELVSKGTNAEYSGDDKQAAQDFVGSLMNGVNLQLGTGSGIYAILGETVGELSANITIGTISYGSLSVPNVKASIVTTTEAAIGIAHMKSTNLLCAGLTPMQSTSNAANIIDVKYGYIVDFMFRTNASGSKLMLQTTPAQRVYEDSTNNLTQGSGSTMTFSTEFLPSGSSATKMMDSIRVVFMDTQTKQVYGVAKIEGAVEDATAGTVTGQLYLYNYTFDNGVLTIGNKIAEEEATICDLPANTAKGVSALVYLDGDQITNEDVPNADVAATGTLNLQFASSAELVPMENSALKNGSVEDTTDTTAAVTTAPDTTAAQG